MVLAHVLRIDFVAFLTLALARGRSRDYPIFNSK